MEMFDWRDYGNGIIAFDAGYVRPILAAIHMIVDDGRVAFIDTGSNDSLPNVLAALDKVGLGRDAVDYVILTHIHLDHAGGAGALMREFPNARLVVHPRGSRHMAEPSKLVAGVTAVYGKEYVEAVYGDIMPIAAERIIDAHEGLTLQLGGRELLMIDTPGHAKHHICIVDRQANAIFSGDMFGLSYREFDVAGRQFILPTTTPTQFDPASKYHDPDSSPDDPRWDWVTVGPVKKLRFVPLDTLRSMPELAECRLLARGNRLSVMPLSDDEFAAIARAGGVSR